MPPAFSRMATRANADTGCWDGGNWRLRAWRCTKPAVLLFAWRGSRAPGRACGGLAVLILANVAGLSDEQCAAIRRFVGRGGSLIATGESTLYNEWGDARPDFALADLLRVHVEGKAVRPQAASPGGGGRGG